MGKSAPANSSDAQSRGTVRVRAGDIRVASYLAKANPAWFGICLVTATGAVYEVGDTRQPFTEVLEFRP